MDKGWIKLYRRILNKGWLRTDHNAYIVFSWLLLMADKKTGQYTLGRTYCDEVGLKPTTFYAVLHRLQNKYNVVTLSTGKATIKYTVVTVRNWHLYQDDDRKTDNPVTIPRQSNDTKQEEEEEKNKRGVSPPTSKNALVPMTNDEIFELARSMQVELSEVSEMHATVLRKVKEGYMQKRKLKTVYHTVRNWISMRIDRGDPVARWTPFYEDTFESRSPKNKPEMWDGYRKRLKDEGLL